MNTKFKKIEAAIEAIRLGKMIILVDDESRENEGDLIIAAEKITPEAINFMSLYARGLICMPMMASDFDRLGIPLMVSQNRNKYATAFGVSIGAAEGVSTGISAADRAKTIQVAADPQSTNADIIMPGHVFPLRAREEGVFARRGHTEGSVDLARLAGLRPSAVVCEVMNEDGSMARRPDLEIFAKKHDLLIISVEDLVQYRLAHEKPQTNAANMPEDSLIKEVATSSISLNTSGKFTIKVFENKIDGLQHVALINDQMDPTQTVLVRIHSECFTGDVLGSTRCDCGLQLAAALQTISEQGGVLLYLRQEGRGIGLANKIKAYALQDEGLDTVEANHKLGFASDQRDYAVAAQMLTHLGVRQIKLLTNNPAKISGLEQHGIQVSSREPLEIVSVATNLNYLKTKRDKLGHWLNLNNNTKKD